jgi:cobyrinic acid a,c-diamide synthase
VTKRIFQTRTDSKSLNIAIALDEAFHCYFPDTLDLLESRGAKLRDFSPIRNEMLPDRTDIVYIGCGPAEQFADSLARNYCMKEALRRHVSRGGRIYAEGSGLAYLAQQMILPHGNGMPMCGVLPIDAIFDPSAAANRPMQLTLVHDCWLGRASTKLRGYLNGRWLVAPADCPVDASGRNSRMEFVSCHEVIGSRLNVDFAAQPIFIDRFFRPVTPPADVVPAR